MKTKLNPGSITVLLVAASLGLPAVAQSNSTPQTPPQVQTGASTNANTPQGQNGTPETGTGKAPLATKSNEGFWGHMNPFARKKWVARQIDPVKDRLNELDQLQAKNANDIKDVDQRAQNGIHAAQSTADQANQTAGQASQTANQATQVAQTASSKTEQLGQTVAGIDQFLNIVFVFIVSQKCPSSRDANLRVLVSVGETIWMRSKPRRQASW